MSIDWEQERRRRQARDDAFMAELRAEHRHELRVTLVGGAIGLALTLLATLAAFAIWGNTVPLEVSIAGGFLGIVFALGGVVLAHVIDDRGRQKRAKLAARL